MQYGEKLKEIRIKNNLTGTKMAEILNISQVTYSHYEIQERIIPIERLNDISNYFDISIDYIFSLTNINSYKNSLKEIDKKLAGQRLKGFRKENKLTQEKLAKSLNTVHSVITKIENGTYIISTAFLYTICIKYKISADYLLGKIDNPKYLK
ncbi:MAG: helix-turn-helix domain-containing protein [Ruminococcus sp.]|nr:helix-turn-helix domain-containing protein [Ruminococcus sp.]